MSNALDALRHRTENHELRQELSASVKELTALKQFEKHNGSPGHATIFRVKR